MKELALALGGGGYKGIAHIGVIRALKAQGYAIKAIAGTSIGGLIGAVYASGIECDALEKLVNDLEPRKLYTWGTGENASLLGLSSISDLLIDNIGDRTFESLPIPFACSAVDINTGQEYALNAGRVMDAALATIAIPGVFPAQVTGNLTLVDGGVLDPVPVKIARWLAPTLPVVAVCLHPEPSEWRTLPDQTLPKPDGITGRLLEQISRSRLSQAMQLFVKSFDVSNRMLAEAMLQIDKPDIILRPAVGQYGILDIGPVDELIEAGMAAVEEQKTAIRELFTLQRRLGRALLPADKPADLKFISDTDASSLDVDDVALE